jgi:hypothetical protein
MCHLERKYSAIVSAMSSIGRCKGKSDEASLEDYDKYYKLFPVSKKVVKQLKVFYATNHTKGVIKCT